MSTENTATTAATVAGVGCGGVALAFGLGCLVCVVLAGLFLLAFTVLVPALVR